MTMAVTPTAVPVSIRESLAGAELRRGLVALLKRRVPPAEVEDVAQTVLCDALASQSVPADPTELRRWIAGIARHKAADFHRRSVRATLPADDVDEPATSPAPFEERQLLESVLGSVQSRRDAETMEWLVREHAGERLCDIAEDAGVSAPVVRQRVSRMRRALRARWAALGALVLALGASLGALHELAAPERAEIVADPSLDASARALGAALGDWVVDDIAVSPDAPASQRTLVELSARGATVHVARDRVEVVASGRRSVRSIVDLDRSGDVLRVALAPAGGAARADLEVELGNEALVVRFDQGGVRGTARLRRGR